MGYMGLNILFASVLGQLMNAFGKERCTSKTASKNYWKLKLMTNHWCTSGLIDSAVDSLPSPNDTTVDQWWIDKEASPLPTASSVNCPFSQHPVQHIFGPLKLQMSRIPIIGFP